MQEVNESDVHGPIDFVLIEFSGDHPSGETAAALSDLVERGVIALYDLAIVRKDADGNVTEVIGEDGLPDALGGFGAFAGARSGLLDSEDLSDAADAMEPGTAAALIVYENSWAGPFVAAARRAGGEMVASLRIPAAEVMDVLDSLEAVGQ